MALLETTPSPSREQMFDAMSGNLCRCGAYEGIVDAVTEAAGVSPRLIKTEAVVEGRVEERWTLVEDDVTTPEYDDV